MIRYDNIFLIGGFNVDKNDTSLKDFCYLCNLKHLTKVPTGYKNLENASLIDPMLTNPHRSFQNSCAVETGLSFYHKMTLIVLKCFQNKNEHK